MLERPLPAELLGNVAGESGPPDIVPPAIGECALVPTLAVKSHDNRSPRASNVAEAQLAVDKGRVLAAHKRDIENTLKARTSNDSPDDKPK